MDGRPTYYLAAEEHDHDLGGGAGPPARSYAVCSTPRSGSSLLSEALAGTGRLGVPLEYFDRTGAHPVLRDRWGCGDVECFVRCLHRFRTGPSGVFGVKLHWFQLADVAAELGGGAPGPPGYEQERAALQRIAPGADLVYVHRQDRDRQAVSWAIAELTGRWERRGRDDVPAVDDVAPDAIARCRRRIDESDLAWRQLFARVGPPVATVTYEELTADHAGVVGGVAGRLGAAGARVPAPTLVRQADARTEVLLDRYRTNRTTA